MHPDCCDRPASGEGKKALQIHGGFGYAMESAVQRFYRDCKVLEIGEGTSQIQRNTIARLLGLPA